MEAHENYFLQLVSVGHYANSSKEDLDDTNPNYGPVKVPNKVMLVLRTCVKFGDKRCSFEGNLNLT